MSRLGIGLEAINCGPRRESCPEPIVIFFQVTSGTSPIAVIENHFFSNLPRIAAAGWLYMAHKRFGLRVLNYNVTSNHIHLLVEDQGQDEIAQSMQLVAGRVAQEYNRRKKRCGAYWEDRYHATAVDSEGYLARCLTYIDLNMVRAGVVVHPRDWRDSGYHELQTPPGRYRVTSMERLMELLGISSMSELQEARAAWIEDALHVGVQARCSNWSDGIAVGSDDFVEEIKAKLGYSAVHRNSTREEDIYALQEAVPRYSVHFGAQNVPLSTKSRLVEG